MTGRRSPAARLALGFAAGFLAVLLFHQGMAGLLHAAALTPRPPYSLQPVPPLGVPSVLSAAFWGGVWGVAFALVERAFPRGAGYWLTSALFGAAALTLVAWFVVQPLKGLAPGNGWGFPGVLVGPLVNGAWGIGTALLLRAVQR